MSVWPRTSNWTFTLSKWSAHHADNGKVWQRVPHSTLLLRDCLVPLRQEQRHRHRQRHADSGGGEECMMSGDSSADIRALPRAYVRYKTGSQLVGSHQSAQRAHLSARMIRRVRSRGQRRIQKGGAYHIFGWFTLLYSRHKYNIVKQLYLTTASTSTSLSFGCYLGLKYLFLHSLPSNMLLILLYAAEIPFFCNLLWHLIWIKYCFLGTATAHCL